MTYQLRDYQQKLLQRIFSEWSAGNRRVMMQLATGAGKTVLFAALAREILAKGEGVLVVAHREELLLQAKEKLEAIAQQPCGLIKAGYKSSPLFPIQIASIQSLARRTLPAKIGLVIVDEAHHSAASTYKKVLEHYHNAYILGVTATPARNDGRGFRDLYDILALGPTTAQLIKAGHLCQYRLFASPKPIIPGDIRVTAGDYNQQDLAAALDMQVIVGDAIASYRKHANCKKMIVFTVSVEHSQIVTAAYLDAGIMAEHLDGTTPAAEREAILDRFRSGSTAILSNCGIISEGFDLPNIEVIQCLKPTQSLNLWLQMIGRALRPSSGKEHATILDHTQNWIFHGLPDDDRHWTLDAVSMSNQLLAVQCPECQHIFRPLPHEVYNATCPNCGVVVTVKESDGGEPINGDGRQIEEKPEIELEEIRLGVHPLVANLLEDLKAVQTERNYKPMWIYHRLTAIFPDLGLQELTACARAIGYKPGWAWYEYLRLKEKVEE